MNITSHDVRRFQQLWRDHYGEELTDEQTKQYAERLLRYVSLVLSPDDQRERSPP